jgi:hypothetical protein
MKSRRGVSQIIGALFALAIVAAFGSVLLIQGVQGVENFRSIINVFEEFKTPASQEILIIEHVRFHPASPKIDIWLRNTGTVDITVDKISLIKVNTQEVILDGSKTPILISDEVANTASLTCVGNAETIKIFQKEMKHICFDNDDVTMPSINNPGADEWRDELVTNPEQNDYEYRLSIITTHGNTFEAILTLFNN